MERRKIEIFSAGCFLCEEVIAKLKAEADSSCDIEVRSMSEAATIDDAKRYGIKCVPAVVINGKLVDHHQSQEIDLEVIRELIL